MIHTWGGAHTWEHLDATEVQAQVSSHNEAHSAMHSDYKGRDTVKHLAGCCPIGAISGEMVPREGHPGSISDPIMTKRMRILETIPFGMSVEVDKGFCVDNQAVEQGVGVHHPCKKLKGQTQQSQADTVLTQKVGKTRIVIENVNAGAKIMGGYFNCVFPLTQLGLALILL